MSEEQEREPVDPFLNQDLMPLAKSSHDFFVAFLTAGFTEQQGISIVAALIADMIRGMRPAG